MKRAGKVVAMVSTFSTLLMGCYNSALIYPSGYGGGRLSSDRIKWVATKDGTRYQFDAPPTCVKGAIVLKPTGDGKNKISSDEISYVITKDGTKHMFDEPPAIVNDTIVIKATFDEKGEIYSGKIEYVIMKDGTKRIFDVPPSASDSAIVFNPLVSIPLSDVVLFSSGGEENKLYMDRLQSVVTKDGTKYEFATPPTISHETIVGVPVNNPISIPLSDVMCVYVTEFNYVKTGLLVVGTGALVFGMIAVSNFDFNFPGLTK